MPTKEEIRAGITNILCSHFKDPVDTDCPYCVATDKLIDYLHSQGLVIKVERAAVEPLIDVCDSCLP